MSLKHAILAVLSHKDRSGYDLTRKMDGSVANFWPATHQQIYIELKKLDQSSLVSFKLKKQKGKPDKKLYSITKLGLLELKSWASEDLELSVSKDALLIKIFAAHVIGFEKLTKELLNLRRLHRAKLVEYEEIEKEHFKGKIPPRLLAQYLTLRRGVHFERSWLNWCDESLSQIANGAE